jgi:NAD-dependent deacetylase
MNELSPQQCARLIESSLSIAVLSGAGISTAAGIPDFRGPQGLYVTRKHDPEKVFEINYFYAEPEYFYYFTNDFIEAVNDITPTYTHRFLARLEKQGLLDHIITQNIDLLHYLAGNRQIIDLHGSYNSAHCTGCGTCYSDLTYSWWKSTMAESSSYPVARCRKCKGVLKPDIVFFGEMVNQFHAAERVVKNCDLLLILGSSLQVAPASHLPLLTNAPTIVINKGDVMLGNADNRYFVNQELDHFFQQVNHFLS